MKKKDGAEGEITVTIQTERLTLREMREEDFDALNRVLSDAQIMDTIVNAWQDMAMPVGGTL